MLARPAIAEARSPKRLSSCVQRRMQYSLNSHAIGQVSVVNAVSSIGEQPKPFGKVFTPAPELRKVSKQRALLLVLRLQSLQMQKCFLVKEVVYFSALLILDGQRLVRTRLESMPLFFGKPDVHRLFISQAFRICQSAAHFKCQQRLA